MVKHSIRLDLRGLRCPLPVLRLRKLTQSLTANTIIDVHVSDRMALKDVPDYAQERQWKVLDVVDHEGLMTIKIQL